MQRFLLKAATCEPEIKMMSAKQLALIRPASVSDLAAIMELERRAPTAAHWLEDQYRCLFAPGGTPSQRLTLVVDPLADDFAKDGERCSVVQGFLVARGVGGEWEIENLVVAEAFRRKGLGKQLVRELISKARVLGAEAVFLEVRESNQAARSLYESLGFLVSGRRKGYYVDPAEDAVVYRLVVR
jgi:ribosomal-protein-alanine N-acetyltransferase